MSIPPGTRFRADYQRTVDIADDGVQTHAISYPAPLGHWGTLFNPTEPVGHVTACVNGDHAYAKDADGTELSTHEGPDAINQAVIAVIEHDQAKYNH